MSQAGYTARRDAFRFFLDHAGYVQGRHAAGALALVRAETLLHEARDEDVARIEWEDDDLPYEHDGFTDEEIAAKFESNEWVGPLSCALYVGDEVVASLSGIVVGSRGVDDPYCRVVEAELASEAEDAIRSALSRRDVWSFTEHAPDFASDVADLWHWSTNYDAGRGPFTLFVDLIGWSDDNLGEPLYSLKDASLGYLELAKLSAALAQYAERPHDVRAWVDELLTFDES